MSLQGLTMNMPSLVPSIIRDAARRLPVQPRADHPPR